MELLKSLFEGVEGLGADFEAKVSTLFEASVTEAAAARVADEVKRLSEEFDGKVESAVTEHTSKLEESVSAFLDKTIAEWAKEHAPVIDSNIKVAIAEKFLTDLTGLFEYNQVALPAGDTTKVVTDLQAKLSEATATAEAHATALTEATAKLEGIERTKILDEAVTGLADTQKDRVLKLVESLPSKSLEDFKQKVSFVVEAVSGAKAPVATTPAVESPATPPATPVTEAVDTTLKTVVVDPMVERTLAAMRRGK